MVRVCLLAEEYYCCTESEQAERDNVTSETVKGVISSVIVGNTTEQVLVSVSFFSSSVLSELMQSLRDRGLLALCAWEIGNTKVLNLRIDPGKIGLFLRK